MNFINLSLGLILEISVMQICPLEHYKSVCTPEKWQSLVWFWRIIYDRLVPVHFVREEQWGTSCTWCQRPDPAENSPSLPNDCGRTQKWSTFLWFFKMLANLNILNSGTMLLAWKIFCKVEYLICSASSV